jgi:hypothetical protein
VGAAGEPPSSSAVDFDNGLGEDLRGFIRLIVTDALQEAVQVPENLIATGCAVRGRAVILSVNAGRESVEVVAPRIVLELENS